MADQNNEQILAQVTALAAMAQAIDLVQKVAWQGNSIESELRPLLISLLKSNAPTAAAVYDGTFELNSGLRLIRRQLDTGSAGKDPNFVSLMINVIVLQKQLSANKTMMDKLTAEINKLEDQYDLNQVYKDPQTLEQLIESASDIYRSTLSQLPNRIQIKGEPVHLKSEQNQAIIRAALLSAIRATFMWRQYGGSRWHFIFKKGAILAGAEKLIKHPFSADDGI